MRIIEIILVIGNNCQSQQEKSSTRCKTLARYQGINKWPSPKGLGRKMLKCSVSDENEKWKPKLKSQRAQIENLKKSKGSEGREAQSYR